MDVLDIFLPYPVFIHTSLCFDSFMDEYCDRNYGIAIFKLLFKYSIQLISMTTQLVCVSNYTHQQHYHESRAYVSLKSQSLIVFRRPIVTDANPVE